MRALIQTLLLCLILCATQAGVCSPPCTADIITANQQICDNFFMISATPPEAGETGAWTGPAGTSFVDVSDPNTFITNLNAGSNIIIWTIFDSGGTVCSTDQITIINSEVQTTPIITTLNNTEVCNENGFQIAAQGPLLPGETGFWSSDNGNVTFNNPNGLTTTANNLGPGNNVIFWNITSGICSANPASIIVVNNEVITVNINTTNSDSNACADTPFNLVADPPLANQTGIWTGPAGSIFSPDASSPTVIVTDAPVGVHDFTWTLTQGGCNLSDAIQVEIYPQPVGTYVANPTTTVGGNNGSIDICVESGTSPFNITWSPSQGTVMLTNDPACPGESFNIGGLTAGMYVVTITDANGCEFITNDTTVNDPACAISIDASDIGITNVSCNGANDGSITISGTTNTPPLTYSIDGGLTYSSTNVFDNLPAGTYQVFIYDAQLCTAGPVAVTITEPEVLMTTPTTIQVSTVGGSDGQILLCVEGGTPPHTVTWSPSNVGSVGPSTDPNCAGESLAITELPASMYTVTITDANNCTDILNTAIYEYRDLVLPGNFDNDAIAEGKDLLYWGAAYGYTGPPRLDATTDWTPQYNAEDWDDSVDGINSKHQDANGDGIVDTLDLEALEINYDETYGIDSFEYHPTNAMFVIKELAVSGNEVSFELHIASDTPISTHGINSKIDISGFNGVFDVQIDTIDSSLHPDAYIYRYDEDIIDIALTRTDRIDQIIDGPVVSLVVMVKDVQSLIIPVNGGYTMSAAGELTSVGGSTTYDSLSTLVSLGVNHVYCDEKGTAVVYMEDASLYSCVWSTGETTLSVNDLAVGKYGVTVSDGIGTTMIDFDIADECPTSDSLEVSTFAPPVSPPLSAHLINSLGEVPRLAYELEQSGTVDIDLYNIHGQRLRTLQTGKIGVGDYQIDIDKSNIPRGIYFIYIYYESNGHIRSKTLKILI